jgi:hypothetical protein
MNPSVVARLVKLSTGKRFSKFDTGKQILVQAGLLNDGNAEDRWNTWKKEHVLAWFPPENTFLSGGLLRGGYAGIIGIEKAKGKRSGRLL